MRKFNIGKKDTESYLVVFRHMEWVKYKGKGKEGRGKEGREVDGSTQVTQCKVIKHQIKVVPHGVLRRNTLIKKTRQITSVGVYSDTFHNNNKNLS